MRWWAVLTGCVAALAVGVSSPGDAWALSCDKGWQNQSLSGDGLPVSALGIAWLFPWAGDFDSRVTLERHDGVEYVRVEHEVREFEYDGGAFFVAPVERWQVGERYRLTVTVSEEADRQHEVTIVEDPVNAAVEARVDEMVTGEIEVSNGDGYSTYIGGVSREIDVVGHVGLDGLVDSLFYEVLVDGERYRFLHASCAERFPGALSDRRENVKLVTFCEESSRKDYQGVSEGEHDVVVRAYFPGTELSWESRHEDVVMVCPGDDGGVGCTARGADGVSPAEGRGCAVGGANETSPGGELLLLGFGGVIAWRREQNGRARG